MSKTKANIEAIRKAVQICGGNMKMSTKYGISYASIVHWKNGRIAPNPVSCLKIETATGGAVTRRDILPDYPWDEFESQVNKKGQ
jgi:DNA-binding transcriptional regulator YdaS (Cro superfamily)